MLINRSMLVLASFLFARAGCAVAQEASPNTSLINPGDRVRITAPGLSDRRVIGKARIFRGDTLVIYPEGRGQPSIFPLSALDSLEKSRGKRHLPAAFLGLVAGGATGALLGGGIPALGGGGPVTAIGATYGTFVGAAVGAIVLGARGFERWKPVPVMGVTAGAAGSGGVMVGLALAI